MIAHGHVVASLVLACGGPVAERTGEVQGSGAALETTSALVTRLAARTDHLRSFVASYRLTLEEGDAVLSLRYQAPDRAMCEFHGKVGEESIDLEGWSLGDRVVFHADGEHGAIAADFLVTDVFASDARFSSVFDEVFPKQEGPANDLGPGARFALEFVKDKKSPTGRTVSLQVGSFPCRKHILSWFDKPEGWRDARREGRRLVREEAGMTIALSTETGFIEEVKTEKSTFRLETLKLDEAIDASAFIVHAAKEGARDVSREFEAHQAEMMRVLERGRAYAAANRNVKQDSGQQKEFESRVAKVFDVLHTPVLRSASSEWVEKTDARVDEFVAWYATEYEQSAGDVDRRKQLGKTAAKVRSDLEAGFASYLDPYVAHIEAPTIPDVDAGDTAWIVRVEREAVRAAAEGQIRTPLLKRFDDGIAAAHAR